MEFFIERFPLFLDGAYYTVMVTLGGCALAFVLAMVIGIAGTTRFGVLRAVATVYVETFRGVAALVLMFWMAFAIPEVTPFRLDATVAGIIALGLNVGAYGSEVVRAAINAVPRAQIEATVALSMTWWQRTWLVVLPQAWAQMLPTFGNLVIELMKATAVVSLIGVTDIMWIAQLQRDATGETVLAFGSALVMYFVIAQVLVFLVRLLELNANRRLGRAPAGGGGLRSLLRPPSPVGGGK